MTRSELVFCCACVSSIIFALVILIALAFGFPIQRWEQGAILCEVITLNALLLRMHR